MKTKLFKRLSMLIFGGVMVLSAALGISNNNKVNKATYAGSQWTKITSLEDIHSGDSFAIVNDGKYLPAKNFAAKSSGGSEFNPSVTTQVDALWTFTGNSTDGYKISVVKNSTTYYLGFKNDNNGVQCITESSTWTFTLGSGDYKTDFMMVSSDGTNDRYLTYASGNFRCYKTSGSIGIKYCSLYKLDGNANALPKITGLENDKVYNPTGDDIELGIEWSNETVPEITSYEWTLTGDGASLSATDIANPTLIFDKNVTEYLGATIGLKINNDEKLSCSTSIHIAPHILSRLLIPAGTKSLFYVDDPFDIQATDIVAEYVDGDNKNLTQEDLTYTIGGMPINIGDKMSLSYGGNDICASYTDNGITCSEYLPLLVYPKEMPTPVFQNGWNRLRNGSVLSEGNKIVFVANPTGSAVGLGNKTAANNIPGVSIVNSAFNNDCSKITSMPDNVAILLVEKGTKEGTISFYYSGNDKDGNPIGGYLAAANSSSNWLHVDSEKTDNASFTYSFDAKDEIILEAQGNFTRNDLRFNSSTNPTIFSCYNNSQNTFAIFRNEKVNLDEQYAQKWINDYMHLQDISTVEKGNGSCISSGWYADAKEALLATNENDSSDTNAIINVLINSTDENFVNAIARYEEWARNNGDDKPYGDTGIVPTLQINKNNVPSFGDDDSNVLLVMISLTSSLGLAAVLLYRKKKHTN